MAPPNTYSLGNKPSYGDLWGTLTPTIVTHLSFLSPAKFQFMFSNITSFFCYSYQSFFHSSISAYSLYFGRVFQAHVYITDFLLYSLSVAILLSLYISNYIIYLLSDALLYIFLYSSAIYMFP